MTDLISILRNNAVDALQIAVEAPTDDNDAMAGHAVGLLIGGLEKGGRVTEAQNLDALCESDDVSNADLIDAVSCIAE